MGLQCRRPRFNPWIEKISQRRKWQPTPVEKSTWQAIVYGVAKSDRTERLNHQHPGITMQCIHCTPRDLSKRIKNISTQKLVHECSRQHDSQQCKSGNKPKCLSADEQVNTVGQPSTRIFLAIKRNKLLCHARTGICLENIRLSERCQSQKATQCMVPFI